MSQTDELVINLIFEHWESPDEDMIVVAPDGTRYDLEDDSERETALNELLESGTVPEDNEVALGANRALGEDAAPESREWDAWLLLYQQKGSSGRYFHLEGFYDDDEDFAEVTYNSLYGETPNLLVIDWRATAEGMLSDYTVIELDNGERAYFRAS